MKYLFRPILLGILFHLAKCDNILISHPFYSGSHVLTLHSITEKLIERGHRVTTVRFMDKHDLKLKPLGPKHTDILLGINNTNGEIGFLTKEESGRFEMPLDILWSNGLAIQSLLELKSNPWKVVDKFCEIILSSKIFDQLEAQKFDLALVDLLYNECGLALANALEIPIVGYWAFSFTSGQCEYPAVSTPPSYIPAFMTEYSDRMTFFQRTHNLFRKALSRALMAFHFSYTDSFISKYSRKKDVPSSVELLSNLNGLLINSNDLLDYPRLKAESMINVGGLQIKTTLNTLPKVIQDWIDGAEHGIILFSMGFIFNPKVVPEHQVMNLLNAFKRLPQRVIVKFESETPIKAPDNVLILNFLPQQEILAHPKTKAFFTHCGMHGVLEAIYYAVPMIGMPIFADQGDVATRMTTKGIAVRLDKSAGEEEIYQAITEVLRNPKYKKNIERLSKLFKLQRHHPIEDSIWLLEYVSKTKGAHHMLPAGQKLNFFQYYSIDVILFLIVNLYVFALIVKWICPSRKSVGKFKRD